jgi:hypothetical protein
LSPARFTRYTRTPPILRNSVGALLLATALTAGAQDPQPPAGFTALFDGHDLAGWRGGSTFDPRKLADMPDDQRKAQIEKWTATMKEHWRAENGELVDDGNGDYARQVHGSAYRMAAAQRGYQHPTGEWNYEEVTVQGSTIKVELNGTVILDADLSQVDPGTYMAGHAHPGVSRTRGQFGFAGHNDHVEFRNIEIKPQ